MSINISWLNNIASVEPTNFYGNYQPPYVPLLGLHKVLASIHKIMRKSNN